MLGRVSQRQALQTEYTASCLRWGSAWLGASVYSATGCTADSSRDDTVAPCTPVYGGCAGWG
jgi:hypothetical protein